MTVEKFLQFVISHNATIIEVLIGLTLLAVLFLSIRMFLFAKEPSAASSGLDMGQLEGTLKQILEKAGQVPAPMAEGSAGSSEDSQKLLAEISNLKTELEARQNQIETLKSAPAGAGEASASGLSEEEKSKLESQIQELQAKLSEYEIISEDIADLSFYKEQNVKLQKELETLKSGGAAVAAPAAAAAPAPAPAPPAAPAEPAVAAVPPAPPVVEPEIVGKSKVEEVATIADPIPDPFAEAMAAADSTPASAPEAEKNLIDDDLMAEFAAAVEKQKASSETPAAPAPASTPAPAAAPKAQASSEAGEPSVDLGQMDMDKMLAEAADIKTDVPEVDPEKALGTGLDENKLLQEAAALEGVTSEDKKLMGDFENFVKKSES